MSKVKKTLLSKPEANFSNTDVAVEVEEDMFLVRLLGNRDPWLDTQYVNMVKRDVSFSLKLDILTTESDKPFVYLSCTNCGL